MWFNSMQREEPYQGLLEVLVSRKGILIPLLQVVHGCRQLVS